MKANKNSKKKNDYLKLYTFCEGFSLLNYKRRAPHLQPFKKKEGAGG